MYKVLMLVVIVLFVMQAHTLHAFGPLNRGASNHGAVVHEEEDNSDTSSVIVVYGRMSCSITQRYLNEFDQFGIAYVFKNIDSAQAERELVSAGLTGSIALPVIAQGGILSMRPPLADLVKANLVEKEGEVQIHQEKTIEIYSVQQCGRTRQYMSELESFGVKFEFFDANDQRVWDKLSRRMTSTGFSGSVNLPVVIISDSVYIQPTLSQTLELLRKGSGE